MWTSSTTPTIYFTFLSASYSEIFVDFISPISNIFHTDKGIKLTQASKSKSSLSKFMFPIEQGIEKLIRSLCLIGNMFWITVLMSAIITTVSLPFKILLLAKISFRNLAYVSIWVNASVKVTSRWIFIQISTNFIKRVSTLAFTNLCGIGISGLYGWGETYGASYSISSNTSFSCDILDFTQLLHFPYRYFYPPLFPSPPNSHLVFPFWLLRANREIWFSNVLL